MATRDERLARNEAAFRDLNERIAEQARTGERPFFVCECSQEDCQSVFSLSVEEHEHLRSAPDRFALCPGHEVLEIERVAEDRGRYLIVRKQGAAANEAERLDSRH